MEQETNSGKNELRPSDDLGKANDASADSQSKTSTPARPGRGRRSRGAAQSPLEEEKEVAVTPARTSSRRASKATTSKSSPSVTALTAKAKRAALQEQRSGLQKEVEAIENQIKSASPEKAASSLEAKSIASPPKLSGRATRGRAVATVTSKAPDKPESAAISGRRSSRKRAPSSQESAPSVTPRQKRVRGKAAQRTSSNSPSVESVADASATDDSASQCSIEELEETAVSVESLVQNDEAEQSSDTADPSPDGATGPSSANPDDLAESPAEPACEPTDPLPENIEESPSGTTPEEEPQEAVIEDPTEDALEEVPQAMDTGECSVACDDKDDASSSGTADTVPAASDSQISTAVVEEAEGMVPEEAPPLSCTDTLTGIVSEGAALPATADSPSAIIADTTDTLPNEGASATSEASPEPGDTLCDCEVPSDDEAATGEVQDTSCSSSRDPLAEDSATHTAVEDTEAGAILEAETLPAEGEDVEEPMDTKVEVEDSNTAAAEPTSPESLDEEDADDMAYSRESFSNSPPEDMGQFEVLEEVNDGAKEECSPRPASSHGRIRPSILLDEDGHNASELLDYTGDDDEDADAVVLTAGDVDDFAAQDDTPTGNAYVDGQRKGDLASKSAPGSSGKNGKSSSSAKTSSPGAEKEKKQRRDLASRTSSGASTGRNTSADSNQPNKRLFRKARYFLLKSNNHENVDLAKSRNVWATMVYNEKKLNKAFKECSNVILIFSVRESRGFQGWARLESEAQRDGTIVPWVLPRSIKPEQLDGLFRLNWIHRGCLDFQRTGHLINPWNENKPVKIGRDGQEVEPVVGEKLCRLFFTHGEGSPSGGADTGRTVMLGSQQASGSQPIIHHRAFEPILVSTSNNGPSSHSSGHNASRHGGDRSGRGGTTHLPPLMPPSFSTNQRQTVATTSAASSSNGNTNNAGGTGSSTTASSRAERFGSPQRHGSPRRGSPHRGSPHRGSPHRGSPRRDSPHRRMADNPPHGSGGRARSPRSDAAAALARNRSRGRERLKWDIGLQDRGDRDHGRNRERARPHDRERGRELDRDRERRHDRSRDDGRKRSGGDHRLNELPSARYDDRRNDDQRSRRGDRYNEPRHPPPPPLRRRSRSRSRSPPPPSSSSRSSHRSSKEYGVQKSTILHGSYDDYLREFGQRQAPVVVPPVVHPIMAAAGTSGVAYGGSSKSKYEKACNEFLLRTSIPSLPLATMPSSSSQRSGTGSGSRSRH